MGSVPAGGHPYLVDVVAALRLARPSVAGIRHGPFLVDCASTLLGLVGSWAERGLQRFVGERDACAKEVAVGRPVPEPLCGSLVVEVEVGVEGGVVGCGFLLLGDGVVVGEQGAVCSGPDAEP
jgi:hypothetical protein